MIRRAAIVLLALLSAHAQTSKPPSTPTFRATSTLVTVNVIVTDQLGRPVDSLQAKDFTLYEDGKRQTISAFEHHLPSATRLPPPLELPPNQYTNFRAQEPGGLTNIVLFDLVNTPLEDQAFARDQLIRFLQTVPAGQRVAVFTLGSRLRQVQGFTDDPAKLLAAAQQLRPGMTALTSSTQRPGDEPSLEARGFSDGVSRFAQALQEEEDFRTAYRVGFTLEAIGALSRSVAGIPGRKNLLWLSSGFPIDIGPNPELADPMRNLSSYQELVNRLGVALASSQMAVYPIDVRGLAVGGFSASSTRTGSFEPARKAQDMSWLWSTHAMMNSIAEQTGGEAFYNTNGVVEVMQRAVDRASHYYTLAYVPRKREWNGKTRSIRVTTRDNTLTLQYRRGYQAMPEKKLEGQSSMRMLFEAMQPGFPDSTMLLMKAQVRPPDDEHPNVRVDYAVVADQLTFVDLPEKGRTATLDFMVVAFDKKGKQAAFEMQRVEGTLRPEDMKLGFAAHQVIQLRPGDYVLKLGAIDLANQKIGTIEVELTVPVTRFAGTKLTVPEKPKP